MPLRASPIKGISKGINFYPQGNRCLLSPAMQPGHARGCPAVGARGAWPRLRGQGPPVQGLGAARGVQHQLGWGRIAGLRGGVPWRGLRSLGCGGEWETTWMVRAFLGWRRVPGRGRSATASCHPGSGPLATPALLNTCAHMCTHTHTHTHICSPDVGEVPHQLPRRLPQGHTHTHAHMHTHMHTHAHFCSLDVGEVPHQLPRRLPKGPAAPRPQGHGPHQGRVAGGLGLGHEKKEKTGIIQSAWAHSHTRASPTHQQLRQGTRG